MATSSPAVRRLPTATAWRRRVCALVLAVTAALGATVAVRSLSGRPHPVPGLAPAATATLRPGPLAGATPRHAAPTPADDVASHATPTPPDGLAALPAGAAAAVSDQIGADRRAYRIAPAPGAGAVGDFVATTPAQGLRARFTAAGATVAHDGTSVTFALTAVNGKPIPAEPQPQPVLRNRRVIYAGPAASTTYANGPLGVDQGFTVTRGAAMTAGAQRTLTLTLATRGAPVHQTGARTLRLGTGLSYRGLSARDARGRALRAWLTTAGSTVTIHVDAAGAAYPIRIDPLIQDSTLEPNVTTNVDGFGASVAIAGNLLVVGAPYTGKSATTSGAYVFQQGSAGWSNATQLAELTAPTADDVTPGGFGDVVAISANGKVIAVGAPDSTFNNKETAAVEDGAVYLYDEPANGWSSATPTGLAQPPSADATAGDGFGTSVSLTDDLLAAGSPDADADSGMAYLYGEPSGGWSSVPAPTTTFSGAGAETLGASVALSPDDDYLVLGAPEATEDSDTDVGQVDVYTRPAGGWSASAPTPAALTLSDINQGQELGEDELGADVAIAADDSAIAAAAPDQDEPARTFDSNGAVYVWAKPSGGWTSATQSAELYDSDTTAAAGEQLGSGSGANPTALSFAGDSVLVGAPGYGDNDDGALYEFDEPTGGWAAAPADTLAGPTIAAGTGAEYASAVAGDADSTVVGELGGDPVSGAAAVGSALVYSYTAPATPSTSTAAPSPTTTNASSAPAPTPTPQPATVDFTISPDVEPVLTGQTLTFSAADPESGVDYEWNFDDHATADGATVSHTFTGSGVFTITLDELINGQSVGSASHNVIVVQNQPPDADFSVLRADQQNGTAASTAVTAPVTIVPDASLPQVDASAQDKITKVEYWFDAADAGQSASCATSTPDPCVNVPTATPDLTCLPDGSCGYDSGNQADPSDADLSAVPGVSTLGTGAVYADGSTSAPPACHSILRLRERPRLERPARGRSARGRRRSHVSRRGTTNPACATTSPSAGFASIQVNFFDAALAQIGDGVNSWASTPEIPVGPQREAVLAGTNAAGNPVVTQPTETVPYAPYGQLNRADADGYLGEQGVPDTDCFPGGDANPDDGQASACKDNAVTWQYGPPLEAGGLAPGETAATENSAVISTIFGPYDLSHFGVNSPDQLEDQWNLLYNYATVLGVDTPLDAQFGPATGATQGSDGSTVPRTVTMVAFNAEGVPSAASTQAVALTPATNPSFSVCVEDVSGNTPCVIAPKTGGLPFTINTGDELRFEVDGQASGSDPVSTYAIAVGQPNTSTVDTAVGKTDQCGAPAGDGSWTDQYPGAPSSTPTPTQTGGGGGTPSGEGSGTTKQAATGPRRRGERLSQPIRNTIPVADYPVKLVDGLQTAGQTIPPFSDLMAGAFPPHDCEGYSERTVNAAAAPGAVPGSGPTVPLHAASSDDRTAQMTGHRERPVSGVGPVTAQPSQPDSYSNLGLALSAATTTPAPTVATGAATAAGEAPILITADADKLDFSFAKPGTYSASIAAYSSAGLGAVTRIDGFLAVPAAHEGFCTSVQSESFAVPVPNSPGSYRSVGFSGNCMTVIRHGSNDQLYASTQPIDVNGIPLAPSPGDSIVISTDTDSFYVTKCTITASELTEQIGGSGGHANPCPDQDNGDLYLALGSGSDHGQNLPGFARLTDVDTAKADAYLLPLTTQALPAVGAAPAKGSAQAQEAVTGCGLYGFSQPWPNAPGAEYDGFDIASAQGACVALTTHQGDARVAFWDYLPQAFSNGATKPDTDQVVLYGSDQPAVSNLTYDPYANVALARARRHIAGDFPSLGALDRSVAASVNPALRRAHDDDLPGFPNIPNCPPDTDGRSGLSIPDNTDLGPITLPVGASFCYIASTGDFIGNVKVDIPGPAPIDGVEVGFEIGHGHLIDAGGDVSGNVPVFPGVFINDFKFDIRTDPTEVAAQITASIIDLLDVTGGVLVEPSKPEVLFEGNVGIAGITFGNFDIEYTKQGVAMKVAFSKDFGPASLDVSISGALSTSPAAFYLEGQGEACLFICLGVEGLVSNEGLAACGSINLLLTTISAGFDVQFSGPDSGVHTFTGCNLEPFIPPSLQGIQGSRRGADTATRRGADPPTPQPVIAPGGSEQIQLHQPTMCPETFAPPAGSPAGKVFMPPTVPYACSTQTIAVQVHSLYNPQDPGSTPLVSLTNANGDTRVAQTPTTPGYWGLDATAAMSGGADTPDDSQTDGSTWLVDQNPVPTQDSVSDSSADCPTSATSTVTSLPGDCPQVTTTTIYIGDPGPGAWTVHVLPGSPAVVDVSLAQEMPPVSATSIGDSVAKPILTSTGHSYAIKLDHRTFGASDIAAKHLLLAQSVELPSSSPTELKRMYEHPAAGDLDVAPIDASLLRAITLKLPKAFPGTVAIIDQGSGCTSMCSQVLASGISSSQIPRAGLPVLFEPITGGSTQTIQAFVSNSAGMPSEVINLATIRSPAVPKPQAPVITHITRSGSNVTLTVNLKNAPLSGRLSIALSAANGAQYDQSFELDDFSAATVTAVASSPETGVGAARHHDVVKLTLTDVDPTASIKVAAATLNDSVLGASSSLHSMHALLPSLSDHALQTRLHLKRKLRRNGK